MASYVTSKADWAPQDFGKPNIDHFGAKSRIWTPTVVTCWAGENEDGHRLLVRLKIDDPAAEKSGLTAWPEKMYLELLFPKSQPVVKIAFYCFGKVANRLPEAMWLTFQPDAPDAKGWTFEKSDYPMSPLEVVAGGNRHMHALSKGDPIQGRFFDRYAGRAGARAGREVADLFFEGPSGPVEGRALQPVQQRLGYKLHTMVRRRLEISI